MKSVFMISTYGDFFWSFERENINLLKELGYKIYLIANFYDKKFNKKISEVTNMHVELINIPFERSPFKIATINNYILLKNLIKKNNPDLVDCHLAVVGVLSRLACWNNKNTKIIYSPHGFFFYKGCSYFNKIVYKSIESILAKKTDALITINKEDYENARKMNVRGKAYYVPGVGVDVDTIINKDVKVNYLRQITGINDKDTILISVGELSKNKNHIVVIEALHYLSNMGINDIHYVICGRDDTERKLIEEKVSSYGLNGRFHFLGYRTDVIDLNKQADCFILPSFKEGLSVSIIEAMACGLPIIASNIRGNIDLIEEEKNGYLFSPTDFKELSQKIIKIIENKNNNKVIKNANINKSKEYSTQCVKNIMQKIYENIVE